MLSDGGNMLNENVIRNELRECVRSKIAAEKMRFEGTEVMSTMAKATLEGQIHAYEVVLELEHGDTYESMRDAIWIDNSD
jgi:hypothetical protein